MYRVTIYTITSNTKTSTLTVTLLDKIERIRRICYRYHSSSQRSLNPFWFQLLTIFFIGRDFFYHRQLLVFRITKIKITISTLITSYTNLATLKLDTHSSVQSLIDFTCTLLTFRFVIPSMRSMVFECFDNFLCFSLRSRTSQQLLNSVIAKNHDLSVSRRSRYFAQPRPIIANYLNHYENTPCNLVWAYREQSVHL